MKKEIIYADHAATTKIDVAALEAMVPYLKNDFGNPSTLYSLARKPKKAVNKARNIIANAINANDSEIHITSCGTEADNWALKGLAFNYIGERKRIITSCIEHHAVLNSCKFLEQIGFDVIYLPVDDKGIVAIRDLESMITEDTILVSIMMANNEIGSIQHIKELAKIAHKNDVLFHTDAVQAVGHIPIDVKDLGVDIMSSSAHKFNGPKGIGFLFLKEGVVLTSLLSGGSQENHSRAGTENVPGIVGMAIALKKNTDLMLDNIEYLNGLVEHFWKTLAKSDLKYISNGAKNRVPGSISVSFKNADGEMLLHRLDLMGIAVSTGSACNSEFSEVSHVLKAIDIPTEFAFGTIRITLGIDNTIEDVEKIVISLEKILVKR